MKPSPFGYPDHISELPEDWRVALSNPRLTYRAGEALVGDAKWSKGRPHMSRPALEAMWYRWTAPPPMQMGSDEESAAAYLDWRAKHLLIEGGEIPELETALADRAAQILRVEPHHPGAVGIAAYAVNHQGDEGALGPIARISARIGMSARRWRNYQREKDLFPYLRYLSDHYCDHPRLKHQDLHGVILPIDHPAWQWMFPPNGWCCNCRVEQVSENRMHRNGWAVSDRADELAIPPTAKFVRADGTAADVPTYVQPGFGHDWASLWPAAASQAIKLLTF